MCDSLNGSSVDVFHLRQTNLEETADKIEAHRRKYHKSFDGVEYDFYAVYKSLNLDKDYPSPPDKTLVTERMHIVVWYEDVPIDSLTKRGDYFRHNEFKAVCAVLKTCKATVLASSMLVDVGHVVHTYDRDDSSLTNTELSITFGYSINLDAVILDPVRKRPPDAWRVEKLSRTVDCMLL